MIFYHKISYNYGLYCWSICGYMDPCQAISTDDTESDFNRACEIFLLGNSSEIQPKLPNQSPY